MQDSAVAAENDMGGPKSTWFHEKKICFIRNQKWTLFIKCYMYLHQFPMANYNERVLIRSSLNVGYNKNQNICENFEFSVDLNFKI